MAPREYDGDADGASLRFDIAAGGGGGDDGGSAPASEQAATRRRVRPRQRSDAHGGASKSRHVREIHRARRAAPRARLGHRALAAAPFRELQAFSKIAYPEEWPFTPDYLSRQDEESDAVFYDEPRFVTHIDDGAIGALRDYYAQEISPKSDVLDICSSWISHLPDGLELGRVAGLGMNEAELERNERLTERVARDLNANPALPYDDASFDVVTNAVSVDYLTRPLEVFRECHRVLKPGGKALFSFSNRCFPTKAVSMWLKTDDSGHIWIVGAYYKYSAAWSVKAVDISPGGGGDPMYVVQGEKL